MDRGRAWTAAPCHPFHTTGACLDWATHTPFPPPLQEEIRWAPHLVHGCAHGFGEVEVVQGTGVGPRGNGRLVHLRRGRGGHDGIVPCGSPSLRPGPPPRGRGSLPPPPHTCRARSPPPHQHDTNAATPRTHHAVDLVGGGAGLDCGMRQVQDLAAQGAGGADALHRLARPGHGCVLLPAVHFLGCPARVVPVGLGDGVGDLGGGLFLFWRAGREESREQWGYK